MSEHETRTVYERLTVFLGCPVTPESDPFTLLFRVDAKLRQLTNKVAALEAQIEKAKALQPFAWQYWFEDPITGSFVWRNSHTEWNGQQPSSCRPIYLNPFPEDA